MRHAGSARTHPGCRSTIKAGKIDPPTSPGHQPLEGNQVNQGRVQVKGLAVHADSFLRRLDDVNAMASASRFQYVNIISKVEQREVLIVAQSRRARPRLVRNAAGRPGYHCA